MEKQSEEEIRFNRLRDAMVRILGALMIVSGVLIFLERLVSEGLHKEEWIWLLPVTFGASLIYMARPGRYDKSP